MSNNAHYELERELKTLIATMPEEKLRALLDEFVTEASVATVHHLAAALSLRPREI